MPDLYDALYDPNYSALGNPRVRKFLNKIGKSEGADYNTLVGGSRIDDLSRHPNRVGLTTNAGPSTAFGKYQIVGTTDRSKLAKYRHLDYSPANQDVRAVELLRQTGALEALERDDEPTAIRLAGKEWASLPGSALPGRKNHAAFQQGAATVTSQKDPYDALYAQQPTSSKATPQVQTPARKPRGMQRVEPEQPANPVPQGRALTVNDAAWHFGMTPEQAQKLTRRQYRVLSKAVAGDERQRAAGYEIREPDDLYQNLMRKRAGLPPLDYNVAEQPRTMQFGTVSVTAPANERRPARYIRPESGSLESFGELRAPRISTRSSQFNFGPPTLSQAASNNQRQLREEAKQRGINVDQVRREVSARLQLQQGPQPYTDEFGTRVRMPTPSTLDVDNETAREVQTRIAEADRKQRVQEKLKTWGGTVEYGLQAPKSSMIGAVDTIGSFLKSVAVLSKEIDDGGVVGTILSGGLTSITGALADDRVEGFTDRDGNPVGDGKGRKKETTDYGSYQLGRAIQDGFRSLVGSDRDLEQEFAVGQAPATIGQVATFMLGGWATKAPKLATLVMGAGLTTSDAYDEVRAAGGTDEQAVMAGLLAGGLLGPTELIGLRGAMKALGDPIRTSTWRAALKIAYKEGRRDLVENILQEVGQEAGQGIITGTTSGKSELFRSPSQLAQAALMGAVGGSVTAPLALIAGRPQGARSAEGVPAADSPTSDREEPAREAATVDSIAPKAGFAGLAALTKDPEYARVEQGYVDGSVPLRERQQAEAVFAERYLNAPDPARAAAGAIEQQIAAKPQEAPISQEVAEVGRGAEQRTDPLDEFIGRRELVTRLEGELAQLQRIGGKGQRTVRRIRQVERQLADARAAVSRDNESAALRLRSEQSQAVEASRYSDTPRFDEWVENETGQRVTSVEPTELANLQERYRTLYADAPAPPALREMPPLDAPIQRFYHRDFGEVEIAPNQRKTGKGRVKVLDNAGNPHYVRGADLSGRGNQRMVPIRSAATPEPSGGERAPEGYTRFYRADRAEAEGPEGAGWSTDPEYVSKKYGAGEQGGESLWRVDVPTQNLDAEFGDARAVSVLRNPEQYGATPPSLARSTASDPTAIANAPVLGQQPTESPRSVTDTVTKLPEQPATIDVPTIEARIAERVRETRDVPTAEFTEEGIRRVVGSQRGSLQDLERLGVITRTPEGRYLLNDAIVTQATEKVVSQPLVSTSARASQLADDRAALDLPELPSAERKSWQQSLSEAKPERASFLAAEVLRKPRALSDSETASLVVRAQQIKNEHAQKMREVESLTDTGEIQQRRSEIETLEKEFDQITSATKASGTEKGRALAAQKLTINQDYDLVSLLQRAKVAKGRELTAQERSRYEQQAKQIADLEQQLSDAQKRNSETRLQREIERAVPQRRPAITKSLDDEFAQLREQFSQARAKTKNVQPSGPAMLDPDGELTKIIMRMARNRASAGVVKLTDLVERLYEALPKGISRRQIKDILVENESSLFRDKQPAYLRTEEIAQNIRRIRESVEGRDEQMLRYALRLPSGRELGVNLNIDGQGRAYVTIKPLGRGPQRNEMVLGRESLPVGAETLRTLKRYLLQAHPNITEFAGQRNQRPISLTPVRRTTPESQQAMDVEAVRSTLAERGLSVTESNDPLPTFSVLNAAGREVAKISNKDRGQALQSLAAYAESRHELRTAARSERRQSLDKEFADLSQQFAAARSDTKRTLGGGLADVDPEGRLTRLLVQMARNRIQAGVTDAAQIVDDVYNSIREHLPEAVTRREVRDAISGYSMSPPKTRTVLERRLAAARTELRRLSKTEDVEAGVRSPKPQGPPKRLVSRNETRRKQLEAQIGEFERRIREQDFSEKPKQEPLPYNSEVRKLQEKATALKNQFEREMERAKPGHFWRQLSGLRKSWMLSGPSTHARNIGGTGGYQVFDEVARLPAVIADAAVAPFTGRRSIQGPSPAAQIDSVLHAIKAGGREAGQIIRQGATQEQLERHQFSEIDTGVKLLDYTSNLVFRFMSASDRVFYQHAYKRNLIDRANVQAKNEGTGKAGARELIDNPPEELDTAAKHDALIATFNNSNALSDAIKRGRGRLGPKANFAIDIVMPFDRTPTNVIARLLEASPVGATQATYRLIKSAVNKSLTQEEQRQFAQTIGRATAGTATVGLGWALAHSLFDVEEYQVFLKLGDRRIGLNSISPVGNQLAVGARLRKNYEEGKKIEALKTLARVPLDQPLLRSGSEITELLRDPQRSMSRTAARQTSSFTPFGGLVRDIAQLTDSEEKRFPQTFSERLKVNIPGLRQQVPISRSPVFTQTTSSPASKEIQRLNINLRGAVKNEKESDSAYSARRAAQNAALKREVERLIESPRYKTLSDEQKRRDIRAITTKIGQAYSGFGGGQRQSIQQLLAAP